MQDKKKFEYEKRISNDQHGKKSNKADILYATQNQ